MTRLVYAMPEASDAYRLRAHIRASELPNALTDLTWDDLDHDPGRAAAIDDAHEWAEGRTAGLVLEGAVGTGKTRIAAVAANHALRLDRHGLKLRWVSAPRLVAEIGAGIGSEPRERALATVISTGALILDDLDKVRATGYAAEQIFTAIDGRVANDAPLLVTTNLTLNEIAARYEQPLGEAIASRLAGYCNRHRVTGHDRRTRTAA